MTVEVKVPEVGESITEVMIVEWLKSEGEAVALDESLAVIETDKATLEIPSPAAGVLVALRKKNGEWANVGDVIAEIDENAEATASPAPAKESEPASPSPVSEGSSAAASDAPGSSVASGTASAFVMPAAARLLAEHDLSPGNVTATGPGGRLLKEDVQRHIDSPGDGGGAAPSPGSPAKAPAPASKPAAPAPPPATAEDRETIVPMSPLRRAVARRLVEAQQTAALLTTFNELDMTAVKSMRKEYGEAFKQRYGIKLGFMSFFVKASVEALKEFPSVNAEVRGTDLVYHNFFDIGIAVGGGKGLVVPVIRGTDRLSFAEIELAIADFGARAMANKIELAELTGGTFTISNGGIYGSLLSTPIVNPPQSGILGLHAIGDRAVVVDGQIVIRPMMNVALTYDHRIVDGREAVTFLRTIKGIIEDPARMILEV